MIQKASKAQLERADADPTRLLQNIQTLSTFCTISPQTRDFLDEASRAYQSSQALAPGLIHGDLHIGNILRSKDGLPVFIDWAETGWGSPLLDLEMYAARLLRWFPQGGPMFWSKVDRLFLEHHGVRVGDLRKIRTLYRPLFLVEYAAATVNLLRCCDDDSTPSPPARDMSGPTRETFVAKNTTKAAMLLKSLHDLERSKRQPS